MTDASSSPSTNVQVGLLRPDEEAAWDAFVDAHPEATIYHTIAWRRVTGDGLGHRPHYLRALDADGNIAGVLPLFVVRGFRGHRLVSVPMRDRAGCLANGDDVATALIRAAMSAADTSGGQYMHLRTMRPLPEAITADLPLTEQQHWITTRIDLRPGIEALWKALDKKAIRWAINKGRRTGVRVELDDSAEAFAAFHELFARTRTKMGIPTFPASLFEAIRRHLVPIGRAQLLTVWVEQERIHAMISFFYKDTYTPAYAAPQNEWRKKYPSEMAIWRSIEWAVEHGHTRYDFGADSPRQEGLLWFKKKWGGVQHPMYSYYYLAAGNQLPDDDSASGRYDVARRIWRHLPLSIAKPLGAFVTRRLS